jgi:predicted RNase H-like HicB family nuclease
MGESRSFNIEILREGEWFVARCVDNIEIASQGALLADAKANLVEALEVYFEDS